MIGGVNPGIAAALTAAVLFGAGTPLSKMLLVQTNPWLLAALLYLGSGIGLWLLRTVRRAPAASLASGEWKWLVGAVVAGGMFAPVLLMTGLSAMPASGAALLLNAEGVLTALLAWFAFKENFDRRIALGMLLITAGACVLSWPADNTLAFASLWPALAVLAACLAWAIDNNLTRKVALSDASWIAMVKGLSAGATNLVLATSVGAGWPGAAHVASAAGIGFFSYGVSLALFVVALRHLGTARTGAYFSTAPFMGAFLALVLLGESTSATFWLAALLMAAGVWLHLTEHHEHPHTHPAVAHRHRHSHDAHHQHTHDFEWDPQQAHEHFHEHPLVIHSHPHFPDADHRHAH
jgi:drug/metabolite transporter (DMT)-like permease